MKAVPTYKELNTVYGNPEFEPGIPDSMFIEKHCVRVILPYPMFLSWEPWTMITAVVIHKKIEIPLLDALEEIRGYEGAEFLAENRLNFFGGSYNYRPVRGGDRLSTHSWAIAIDLNPDIAPYREKDGSRPRWS